MDNGTHWDVAQWHTVANIESAAGARHIVAVDPIAARLELACKGGATAGINKPVDQVQEDVARCCGGHRPGRVIDATGHAGVFADALALPADHGTVVILGDTGSPSRQHLSSDIVRRGLHVVGVHDSHASGDWSQDRIVDLFFHLVSSGRFNVDDLISHTFTPGECQTAYVSATQMPEQVMGILFDWTGSGSSE